MIITKQEFVGSNNTTEMETVIRNVGAKSKEEALGKFILNTSEIKAIKRLDPFCFELDDLLKID